MQFTGTIKKITPEVSVGAKWTIKQSIIVESDSESKYPDAMMFDFIWEEKLANVRALNVWDLVTVQYNSKVTSYNDRDYNNINWWKVTIDKKKEEEEIEDELF
jgi:hypothetical protein